jgi:hypothetical protein
MNKNEIDKFLVEYANKYHVADFIKDDPVQFPHRYTIKTGYRDKWTLCTSF